MVDVRLMFDIVYFFFKQKTAYEMRISDWSSDVCSSDLSNAFVPGGPEALAIKLDSGAINWLPRPVPWREIFAYSPRVEGIHLREIGRASCRERVCQYV